jgi:hypothetical protein
MRKKSIGLAIGDRPLIDVELHHPPRMCGTRFAGKSTDQYLTPTQTRAERRRRGERESVCGRQSFKNAPFRDFIVVPSSGESAPLVIPLVIPLTAVARSSSYLQLSPATKPRERVRSLPDEPA